MYKTTMSKERLPETHEAHFFKGKERAMLSLMSPTMFVASLPESYLFVHIAGAAWDSLYALDDPDKAGAFLRILKSDTWIKRGLVNKPIDPKKETEIAIAFLVANDGLKVDEQQRFIDICKEYEIMVSKKSIEKYAKKIRKNNKNK